MNESPQKRRLTRPQLHRYEERLKYALRDQVSELASFLEVIISVLVLAGLLLSAIPVAQEMMTLWANGSTDAFQTFLEHAFNLVIGIEFIKMLAKHSPGSALEVLLYAIARNMILGHGTAIESLVGVASIGLIFVIRKFFFVPSFGATLPGGEMAEDVAHVFGKTKPIKVRESKDSPVQEAAAKPPADPAPAASESAETATHCNSPPKVRSLQASAGGRTPRGAAAPALAILRPPSKMNREENSRCSVSHTAVAGKTPGAIFFLRSRPAGKPCPVSEQTGDAAVLVAVDVHGGRMAGAGRAWS